MLKKMRVKIGNLKPGMRVADDVYALNGTLIALKNSVVDKRMLTLLEHYFIREVSIQRENVPEDENGCVATKKFTEAFEKMHQDIQMTFDQVIHLEQEINTDEIVAQLETLILESQNNYDLLSMLLDVGQESDSIYQHSIQVSMLSRVIGDWIGMSKEDVDLLGVAGLFHDIGKCQIDVNILNKSGQLSRKEYELIRQHAIIGYKIVKNKNIDIRIKQAVLSHHERCDGSGYPLQIKANGIGQFARIVAIADVYSGMTARRPYRERHYSPFEVVNYLEQEGFGKLDSEYLVVFLSHILNCYIHRKVRLNNGAIGNVIFINKSNLSKPLLKMSNGYLDLSLKPELSIIEVLS